MRNPSVIVAAIGTSHYENVEYRFNDGTTIPAKYFLVGLVDMLKPDTVVVLLTEDARILQWTSVDGAGIGDLLKQRDVNVIAVDIPKGANEAEAWQIFELINSHIPERAEVILDITHGLRSIPVLMLLATFYLQRVRDITISNIFYGALEAVDRSNHTKPAYSLGHFLTLLDWAGGVEVFKQTGDPKRLAELLDARNTSVRKTYTGGPDGERLPTRLKTVSTTLLSLSQALGVIRPIEVMEYASQLQQNLESAADESRTWAKPFALIFDQMRDVFTPLGLTDPLEHSKQQRFIAAQVNLIEWYIRYEQFDAASLLLRELIVTWYMFNKGQTDISNVEARKNIEGDLHRHFENDKRDDLGGLWKSVTEIRNDIAHIGMQKSPKPAKKLSALISKAFDDFKHLLASGNP